MLGTMIGFAFLTAVATTDWSAYRPASPAQVWSEAMVVDGSDYTVEAKNIKFMIDAQYTGEYRKLPAARAELFRRWARSLKHPPEYAKLCSHEIQIEADRQKYWLSLQDTLLASFSAEAQEKSSVRLRIMYIGAVGHERVFVVNSFQVLKR